MAPKCPAPKRHGAEFSSAESAAPSRQRRNGGAEMALPHKLGLVLVKDMLPHPLPPPLNKKSRFDFLVQIVEKRYETN